MKTKYFLLGLAALGFAACSEPIDDTTSINPIGGGTKGYLAIDLKSSDDVVRAATDTYEDGTANEQAISGATFYFFDQAGNAFNVNANGNYVYVSTVGDNNATSAPNIESMTNPVLVVEKYKGQFPSSVVAVLNYKGESSQSLKDLKTVLKGEGHTDGAKFIMTNSVYMNAAGKEVDATPLTIDHFHTTSDKALGSPVTIYVERMNAKVSVATTAEKFNTDVEFENQPVYAAISGWDLVSNQTESYFVKTIDPSWTDGVLGFAWNNAPYYRSYWTKNCVNGAVDNDFAYNDLTNTDATIDYTGEQVDTRAKYVVKAQLQKANGDALEIAQWYGTNYASEAALKVAVAATLQNKFMYKDGDTYTSIDDDQLQCVAGESYEVKFQLAQNVPTTNWYSFDGSTYTPINNINAELAKLEPAKIWKNGMTYYYADIKHLANEKGKVGEYGVVRNHSYKVNIEGVKGWGTPVYDPNQNVVPVKPTDKETYIAAEINVLSWRVVSHNVTLD